MGDQRGRSVRSRAQAKARKWESVRWRWAVEKIQEPGGVGRALLSGV